MSLGGDTVTVLKRSPGVQGRLGTKALIDTPTVVGGCSLQPVSVTEVNTDTDLTIAMWILYTPVVPAIQSLTAADAIQVDVNGVPTVYEDFGDPQLWTDLDGNPDHYRIKLRKARG